MFKEFEGGNYFEDTAADTAACSMGQIVPVMPIMVDINLGRIEAAMRTGWCPVLEEHTAAAVADIAAVAFDIPTTRIS